MLLLITAWRARDNRLPDDDKLLARYAKLGPGQWKRIKPIISDFFTVEEGHWTQRRLTDEATAVRQYRKRQSDAGRASALKRKGRHSTTVETGSNQTATPTPTPTPKLEEANASSAKGARDFPCPDNCDPVDWESLLQTRKAQRKPMTAGAYRQLTSKLGKWKRDGWPPGPILANAAERGWTTVFETDEMKNANGNYRNRETPRDNRSGLARAIDDDLEAIYAAESAGPS